MIHYTDEQLVALYVETHNDVYFAQLYQRYYNKVVGKCIHFTRDPVLAQDLSQDIFIKLVFKLVDYRGQALFSTWLYTITYRVCIDQIYRTEKRKEVWLDPLLEIDSEEYLSEQLEWTLQRQKLTIERLKPEEQRLLKLKYQDDLKISDLALLHGLSESAIKMKLKRTRDSLRKRYVD